MINVRMIHILDPVTVAITLLKAVRRRPESSVDCIAMDSSWALSLMMRFVMLKTEPPMFFLSMSCMSTLLKVFDKIFRTYY